MYSIASGMSLIREVINAHRILEESQRIQFEFCRILISYQRFYAIETILLLRFNVKKLKKTSLLLNYEYALLIYTSHSFQSRHRWSCFACFTYLLT